MSGVYKVIELVGCSDTSWEDAAQTALETASKSLQDLRVAEIVKQDVTIKDGKVDQFRVRLNVSFKYHTGEE
ncbi:MAG: dodecin family protein [Thermovirgaceae bacterium]